MPWRAAQNFRGATFRAAPINKADQTHEKKRFGIAGDEKERGRMREDRHGAENLERGREIPAFAKKKEVTPKTPGGGLRSDEKRGRRFQIQSAAKQSRDARISREKCDVRYFHDLVIDGRNGRGVTAVHDVHEPIAVVLNERGIAIGKRAFRGEQTNRHRDLRQGQDQAGQHRLKRRWQPGHGGRSRNRRGDTKGLGIARTCRVSCECSLKSHVRFNAVFGGRFDGGALRLFSEDSEQKAEARIDNY